MQYSNKIFVLAATLIVVMGCSNKDPQVSQMVQFNVKAEYLEDFKAAAITSLNGSLKEPGNLEMKLYQDKENPTMLFVFSRWINEDAIEYHNIQSHSKPIKALAEKALKMPPKVEVSDNLEINLTNVIEIEPTE